MLSSRAGPKNDAVFRHVRGLVDDALNSKKGKETLLSFRDEHAEVIMNWLQKVRPAAACVDGHRWLTLYMNNVL